MSPFLDALLKLALIGFVIKFLWDGFVKVPQEKLENQVKFLIARYADAILAHPNAEEEIQRIKAQTDWRLNLSVGKSEYENYTEENKAILERVLKKSNNILKKINETITTCI